MNYKQDKPGELQAQLCITNLLIHNRNISYPSYKGLSPSNSTIYI